MRGTASAGTATPLIVADVSTVIVVVASTPSAVVSAFLRAIFKVDSGEDERRGIEVEGAKGMT